ncbi:hypothetical protein C8R45DRAFT_622763 [Mycena sanguinolenta]|nr:hypothetical protein C8R45DRAFT_622763 [Mycena sanguinolenta]
MGGWSFEFTSCTLSVDRAGCDILRVSQVLSVDLHTSIYISISIGSTISLDMASSRKSYTYNERCFHYNDDGISRGHEGYHSSHCRFAHPGDPEWLTARPSRRTIPDFSSSPTKPPFPRRAHDSRSRSPRPAPSRRPRSRSRSRSRTTSHRDQPSTPTESRMDPRKRLSSVASASPKTAFAPPPPPRSAPLPPPSAVISLPPALPAAFTAPGAAPKASTQEETTATWEKILPLLATSVEARKSFSDAENDLKKFDAMLNTPRYQQLITDADRVRVEQERTRLTAARDEASKELTGSLHALKDAAWWPVGPNQDDGAADKYRDIIRYAGELNNTANKMYEAYIKASTTPAVATARVTPVDGPSQQQRDSSDTRPLKRRRVSDAADAAPAMDAASVAELEKMQADVQRLEDQVVDIQNELYAFQTSTMEEVAAQIEARMEPLASDGQDNGGVGAGGDLERLRAMTERTSKDMDDMAQEIVNFMDQSESLRQQDEALRKDIEQQKAQIAAMQTQFDTFQTEMSQDKDTLSALTNAFEKLAAQQPPSPPTLPLDFILAAIDEPIRDTVQAIVRPMVDDLDRDLKEKITTQDKETYGNLWAKIGLTLKVVKAVSNVTQAEPAVGKSKGKSKSPSTNQAAVAQTVP